MRITRSIFFHPRGWDWGAVLTIACGLYVALYLLWSFFGEAGAPSRTLIADLVSLPVNLAAAALAWRAGRHPALDRATRQAWRLLASAYVLYWTGDALGAFFDLVLDMRPFPSWADAGYLLFFPILLWGLLAFPVAPHSRAQRIKFWLDAATVLLAGTMIVWYLVLRPMTVAAPADPLAAALAVAYPVGDLVLLFGITAVELRRPAESSSRALRLLVVGLLLFFVADLVYGSLSLQGAYQSGGVPDTLWIVALFLMLVSAQVQYAQAAHDGPAQPVQATSIRPYSVLSYLAIAIGYGQLLLLNGIDWTTPPGQALLGAIGLTALVVVRQVVAVRENERLLAERAAVERDVRFRALVQNASDIITLIDADGVVRYISPSVEQVLGYTPEEMTGKHSFGYVDASDRAWVRQLANATRGRPGAGPPVDVRVRHRDGSLRYLEAIGNNLLHDPAITGIVLTIRDVTARKQAETELVKEHARFQWVVEQADDGYLALDEHDVVLYANPQARHYLGLARATDSRQGVVDGRQPEERFLALARRQYRTEPAAAWAGWPVVPVGHAPRYLVRPATAAASAFWLQVDVLETSAQTRERSLVKVRDVTATMVERGMMWKFHAAVNHKLRTPLVGLTGFLQIIDDHFWSLPEQQKKDLFGVVRASARTLQERVETIFQYLETPDLAGSNQERYTLAGWMEHVAAIAEQLELRAPAVRVDGIDDPDAIWLALSRPALELIVWELLENVKKFHPRHAPTLDIGVSATPHGVRIRVRDDGIMLAPDQLARLGVPYYQPERYYTGEVVGMGLGLAMVTALLWEVGGSCHIANREAEPGIVVELVVPLVAHGGR